jgi:hypothetical protein
MSLCIGPDSYGGVGVFAGDPIPEGSVVTHYLGPIRFPSLDRGVSKTHSLHIRGDLDAPVDRREYRVIDGFWAQAAIGDCKSIQPIDPSLSPYVGSMINSSRKSSSSDNITTEIYSGKPPFQYSFMTNDVVKGHFTEKQKEDMLLIDESRQWACLPFVSTRYIESGEELLWSYPFRLQ